MTTIQKPVEIDQTLQKLRLCILACDGLEDDGGTLIANWLHEVKSEIEAYVEQKPVALRAVRGGRP